MKILFSEQVSKFLKRNRISDELIGTYINNFMKFAEGEKINIDARKMKGKWAGFYRIRLGKLRMILEPRINQEEIWVERIDFREGVYK